VRALRILVLAAGLLVLSGGSASGGDPKALRVLFVGNSLTATNDLPALTAGIAREAGRRLEYRTIAPGGFRRSRWGGESYPRAAAAGFRRIPLG
jgi:hypothetical protein